MPDQGRAADGRMTRQRRRAEERQKAKADRRGWRPDDDIAVVAGWCATEDDLDDARKQSHDVLVQLLGDRRRGGVSWKWASGDDALAILRGLSDGEKSQEHLDHYRRIRAHLREWGGFVVLAMDAGQGHASRAASTAGCEPMTTRIGPWTRGEIPEDLVYTFLTSNGAKIPLTGFTGVFVIQKIGDEAGEARAATVNVGASTVTYTWREADFAEEASFVGQFWVGDTVHRLASGDYEWDVEEPVAGIVPDI